MKKEEIPAVKRSYIVDLAEPTTHVTIHPSHKNKEHAVTNHTASTTATVLNRDGTFKTGKRPELSLRQ